MKWFKFISAISSIFILLACSSQQKVDILETTARTEASSIQARAASSFANATTIKTDEFVIESSLPILSGRTTVVKRRLPEIFEQQYFFNPATDRRLIDVVKLLTGDTGVVITARDDVYNPTSTRISATDGQGAIDSAAVQLANDVRTETNLQVADRVIVPSGSRYSGTVAGFLDYLASILNISWTYLHEEDRVLLTRYVEKSYRLFVPPIAQGEGDSSGIWDDTKTSIESLLSQGGGVTINQQAGIISVVDTKDVHQMVSEHIQRINRTLQRSVFFNLEILAVNMTDSDAAGVNFNFLHTGAKSSVGLGGGGVSIPGSAGLTASILDGPFIGSQILQQNLQSKGEVSTALSQIIRSMNNQTSIIDKVSTIPVITSYTPPVINNGVTTPGGVTLTDIEVGFLMKMTPSVMSDGQNMVLKLEMETSDIEEIIDVTIGSDGQLIQQARRISRKYDHTFSMKNAETIIISGFYNRSTEFTQKKPSVGWLDWLFSSKADNASRTYYIVLLTPSISNGNGQI